jgi:hypothetical protein
MIPLCTSLGKAWPHGMVAEQYGMQSCCMGHFVDTDSATVSSHQPFEVKLVKPGSVFLHMIYNLVHWVSSYHTP